ncbi:ClpXP protease specificity-enhancing factor [Thermomonas sp.]|uniref:ClpXP protease specificity-enhancing factor n=1 Tax=Thermomonas sp. TaxID=1971895 RepID=UPI0035B29A43
MAEPDPPSMTSQRPYLLRALYEWVVDNGMTPHLLVDARSPGVRVPAHAVKDGQVVLNIADRAVGHMRMDNDGIRFSARFGGVSQNVVVPMAAVIAIYARETGQGLALPMDAAAATPAPMPEVPATSPATADVAADAPPPEDAPEPPKRGNHLRVVK